MSSSKTRYSVRQQIRTAHDMLRRTNCFVIILHPTTSILRKVSFILPFLFWSSRKRISSLLLLSFFGVPVLLRCWYLLVLLRHVLTFFTTDYSAGQAWHVTEFNMCACQQPKTLSSPKIGLDTGQICGHSVSTSFFECKENLWMNLWHHLIS